MEKKLKKTAVQKFRKKSVFFVEKFDFFSEKYWGEKLFFWEIRNFFRWKILGIFFLICASILVSILFSTDIFAPPLPSVWVDCFLFILFIFLSLAFAIKHCNSVRNHKDCSAKVIATLYNSFHHMWARRVTIDILQYCTLR